MTCVPCAVVTLLCFKGANHPQQVKARGAREDQKSGIVFWWTEGNGSCDCSRRRDF